MGREAVSASLGVGVFRVRADGGLEYVDEVVRPLLTEEVLTALIAAAPREGSAEACVGHARVIVRRDGHQVVGLVMLEPPPPRFEIRWDNRVLDRAPDGVLLHRSGRIVAATPRAAALLDHAQVSGLVGAPLPEELRDATGEVRLSRADGERAVELVRLPVTQGGEDAELILIRDLTEQRILQAKLTQSDRLATVGTLAASVAHEINNPLTYVMHYIERLERDLDDMVSEGASARVSKLREGARTAAEGCQRVRSIVRDLKTFARVGDGEDVPIDVNRALRSAVQMAGHQIRSRARLDVELGALPAVRAHDGRLCQVFLNLLMNAGQAIRPGADRKSALVEVRSWSQGATVHVSITDTGRGIADEHLGRLFEPFFSTKPDGVGTGLGLWICRDIVNDLGGRIEVSSRVGRGTTMTIVLPRVAGQPVFASSRPPPDPLSGALELTSLRRVLVVDDEPALLELLAEALGEHADVTTAANGYEARELLENDAEYDVILCDLMMPGMGGVELHGWVASTFPALARRMIFMTGAAYTRAAQEFLSTVDNERLDKPFRVRDVERLLDRVIDAALRVHA